MGNRELKLKLKTDYTKDELHQSVQKQLNKNSKKGKNKKPIVDYSFTIDKKSLDARRKNDIHWQLNVIVDSKQINGIDRVLKDPLNITYSKRQKKVVIVGCGPAGFFAALTLQKAGFETVIVERGAEVLRRSQGIQEFDKTGNFSETCNYSYGEGGAGTFSDGKLTSRTKGISQEKEFVLKTYVNAGASEEILYLAHPHLGSDNLIKIVKKLREEYIELGGSIAFENTVTNINSKNGNVESISVDGDVINGDIFIFAPGHSSFDTYRMLINNGVNFRKKNLAIGSRIEHHQSFINKMQWGHESLPGVKAAEYRLVAKNTGINPVYTFCMCPGGVIVNSTPSKNSSIVNGMSYYKRDGEFANSACVAGVTIDQLANSDLSILETVDYLEALEQSFFNFNNSFRVPGCSINDFINKNIKGDKLVSSYSQGVDIAPLWDYLPVTVSKALTLGLSDFSSRIQGFENGNIIGIETKTSAPIQVVKGETGSCEGIDNLFLIGEGSGYAGGIVSSAVDGVKTALTIIS